MLITNVRPEEDLTFSDSKSIDVGFSPTKSTLIGFSCNIHNYCVFLRSEENCCTETDLFRVQLTPTTDSQATSPTLFEVNLAILVGLSNRFFNLKSEGEFPGIAAKEF
jgi:hypothetical protein